MFSCQFRKVVLHYIGQFVTKNVAEKEGYPHGGKCGICVFGEMLGKRVLAIVEMTAILSLSNDYMRLYILF